MNSKPTIRLIHHLARTGGTVICKCIGSMGNIALLSEIHPLGAPHRNPFIQANNWYKVFSEQDLEFIDSTKFGFSEAMLFIYEKLISHGKMLVIRDWSHLDFFGIPFIDTPSYKIMLAEALKENFDLRQFATVRHPIDQFISTKSLRLHSKDDRMNIPTFLSGYLAFAKQAKGIGFMRYEDFARKPDESLRNMCAQLEIDFDPGYKDKWHSNTCITGDNYDVDNPSPSRGSLSREIKPLPRKEVPIDLPALFNEHVDYHAALDLLGYKHSETGS